MSHSTKSICVASNAAAAAALFIVYWPLHLLMEGVLSLLCWRRRWRPTSCSAGHAPYKLQQMTAFADLAASIQAAIFFNDQLPRLERAGPQRARTGSGSSHSSQLLCATSSASGSMSRPRTCGLPRIAAPMLSMPCVKTWTIRSHMHLCNRIRTCCASITKAVHFHSLPADASPSHIPGQRPFGLQIRCSRSQSDAVSRAGVNTAALAACNCKCLTMCLAASQQDDCTAHRVQHA